MRLSLILARAIDFVAAAWNSIRARIYSKRFSKIGRNVSFDARGIYSYENIEIGNEVNLGYRPILIAAKSKIVIGSHVMFGPEVTIRGGNHRIDIVGRNMIDIGGKEKRPEDDPGVVIEDDVWIGTRAIILAGAKIGRGAVVGAGAVVTKSVPPYAVVGGNPARIIRMRFDPEAIAEHERLLASARSGK